MDKKVKMKISERKKRKINFFHTLRKKEREKKLPKDEAE